MDESNIFPTTKKLLSNLGSGSHWPVFKVRILFLRPFLSSHTWWLVSRYTTVLSPAPHPGLTLPHLCLMSANTRDAAPGPHVTWREDYHEITNNNNICALIQGCYYPFLLILASRRARVPTFHNDECNHCNHFVIPSFDNDPWHLTRDTCLDRKIQNSRVMIISQESKPGPNYLETT